MSKEFHERALIYHRGARPGKIYVSSHKSIDTHQGLSLAYTPGVAAPVREILKNTNTINEYTIKGNLVAVHALKDLAKLPVPDSVLQTY